MSINEPHKKLKKRERDRDRAARGRAGGQRLTAKVRGVSNDRRERETQPPTPGSVLRPQQARGLPELLFLLLPVLPK